MEEKWAVEEHGRAPAVGRWEGSRCLGRSRGPVTERLTQGLGRRSRNERRLNSLYV